MTMNWGTKILLGMGCFMLFIIAMVGYMFAKHDGDALVEEDYYENGINYNTTYNAAQNMLNDDAQPKITVDQKQLVIRLKDSASYQLVLMRPSNKAEDLKFDGKTIGPDHLILVSRAHLPKGMWFLHMQWRSHGKDYLYQTNLTL
ncbi:FixH family protein [Pedobacter psychrotolerans]|uniref:FixH family protein n=1 Tax=Pedobacter psychrotolerans TaxID=1843235 RepID=UPI003F9E401E